MCCFHECQYRILQRPRWTWRTRSFSRLIPLLLLYLLVSTLLFKFHSLNSLYFVLYAEHMLFYASEKYPEEDSYCTYISEVLLLIHNSISKNLFIKNQYNLTLLTHVGFSMEAAQMLLQPQRTPTSILMLILIVLKRLWTGTFSSSLFCCLFFFHHNSNPTISEFSDLLSSLLNLWCQLMLPPGKLKLLILVTSSFLPLTPLNASFIYLFLIISLSLMQRIRKTCCLMLGEWTRYCLLPLLTIFVTQRCWIC